MSGRARRDVDGLEPDLLGERGAEHAFGDDAELDEDLAEPLAAGRLRAERVAELLAREVAALDEQRAERRDRRLGRRRDDAAIVVVEAACVGTGASGITLQFAAHGVTRVVGDRAVPLGTRLGDRRGSA